MVGKSGVVRPVNFLQLCPGDEQSFHNPVGGRFADKPGVKLQGDRLPVPTRAVRSFFDHQPHTLSRLEQATRPYQRPESFIVRFWLRKSV
jgi:hypothetical protein